MQTVEIYAHETIGKYNHFSVTAARLTETLRILSPPEILTRCADLTRLQQELTDTNEHFCHIMECIGATVLDTSYIGELQRAIDTSVLACDALRTELLVHRNALPIVA